MIHSLLFWFGLLTISNGINCNVTGPWTGYIPPKTFDDQEEYYFSSSVYDSTNDDVTFHIIRTVGSGWSNGHGTINLNTLKVSMYLDGSNGTPNSVHLTGTVTNNSCVVINWDNNSKWIKQPLIKYVHVVHMSHLDVGYDGIKPITGYINNVLNVYFQSHLPRAVYLSNTMRQTGHSDRGFIYTQHPWLLSMYLDCPQNFTLNNVTLQCPSKQQKSDLEQAIMNGDMLWHASAFNFEFEAMDETMFQASLNMAKVLNKKYGKSQQNTLSNRDVPGLTRGVIPILAGNNITAISIGQNPTLGPPPEPFGSRYPLYPNIFRWIDDETETEVIAMFHSHGYGGIKRSDCITVPYSNHALCVNVLVDNSGPPQSMQELLNEYSQIESEFPGAYAFSSTFDAFVNEIYSGKDQLPSTNMEFGDVWIQGIQSDPLKMAVYRECSRAHAECIQSGSCLYNDSRIMNFQRYLMKMPEHTWGLPGDKDPIHWSNEEFEQERLTNSKFIICSNAWMEQRLFADYAIQSLQNHPLANDIQQRLKTLAVTSVPDLSKYSVLNDLNTKITNCGKLNLQFDGEYGNVISFEYNNREWADIDSPFGAFQYVTYDETDFAYMCMVYETGCYTKPGSQPYDIRKKWQPKMDGLYIMNDSVCSVVAHVVFPEEAHTIIGAPHDAYINFTVSDTTINLEIILMNKTITRLPEALYYSFKPIVMNSINERINYTALKLNNSHIHFDNVMLNGAQYQHGFWEGIENLIYNSSYNMISKLTIKSLDCGLISPITNQKPDIGWFGTPTVFPCPLKPLSKESISGYAFNFYNNIWMTNYVLWYPYVDTWPLVGSVDQNIKYRFQIDVQT